MNHPIEWRTASPLWNAALENEGDGRLFQPAILRFANDTFMETLEETLQANPSTLRDFVARHEQWDNEDVGWLSNANQTPKKTMKLYQPAHGRFYLIAANLVCRIPGLPDRVVDTANEEKASFVLRRRVTDGDNGVTEYGWVTGGEQLLFQLELTFQSDLDASSDIPANLQQAFLDKKHPIHQGATISIEKENERWLIKDSENKQVYAIRKEAGKLNVYGERRGWAPVSSGEVLDNEERLPLFPMNFKENDQPRHLLAGFIPVASRETYQASPRLSPLNVPGAQLQRDSLGDPRFAEFETSVTGAINLRSAVGEPGNADSVKIKAEEGRGILLFICLDFAIFIEKHLPEVWDAITDRSWSGAASAPKGIFFNTLNSADFVTGVTWVEALEAAFDQKEAILAGGAPTAGSGIAILINPLTIQQIRNAINQLGILQKIDTTYQLNPAFEGEVKNALGPYQKPQGAADPVESPKLDTDNSAKYVIRCVYERPHCKGLFKPVVSRPSQPFRLTGFFDPEAPARQLNITMPIDTSISGLRKFPKKVSFLISKELRRQMARVEGLKLGSLDEGDVRDEDSGINLGMICSFSIPIIAICALILLLIIVNLLNIVFWWLPFFRICFPKR